MIPGAISRYRIVSKLGAGGMGEIYLAEDVTLGRPVALKLLPSRFTQDAERVRRFEQEARSVSTLNHPNILTIYEIGQMRTESGETHFIAMEFVGGQTLRQHLSSRRLSVAEAVEIAVQICSALVAAHGAGITHRDIKPENVMLRHDGLVKVLDFGLAKLTESQLLTTDDPEARADTVEDLYARPDAIGSAADHQDTMPGVILGTVFRAGRLLLPDQHLRRGAAEYGDAARKGCGVESPGDRRGPRRGAHLARRDAGVVRLGLGSQRTRVQTSHRAEPRVYRRPPLVRLGAAVGRAAVRRGAGVRTARPRTGAALAGRQREPGVHLLSGGPLRRSDRTFVEDPGDGRKLRLRAFHLGLSYAHQGKFDQAVAELQRTIELAGGRGALLHSALGYVYGVAGSREQALRILADLQTPPMNRDVLPFHLAMVYAGLADNDQALAWLERAVDERFNWVVWLQTEPVFARLRSDSRFIRLARRVGLIDRARARVRPDLS